MKKITIASLFVLFSISLFAQGPVPSGNARQQKKAEAKRRIARLQKAEEEEGVISNAKHTAFGVQLRTSGYGAFVELGRRRSPRFTNLYSFEFTEIKHNKEEKLQGVGVFSNSFVYGKMNYFYQAKLGFGQQYIFGQKGNKNGVAVLGILEAGLSAGLLRPYYVQVDGTEVKYDSKDSLLFLAAGFSRPAAGAGFTKGWSELKIKPGGFVKAALRFDFGRFNETIQALEIGASVDAYASKIQLLAYNQPKRLFFQGHVAFVFGRRKG